MSNTQITRFAGLAGDVHGIDDNRPPIVLLHGLTFDRTTWKPALEAFRTLDPDRIVLNLDLPGHGDSADFLVPNLESAIDQLGAAVADAGLHEPVMVGHSVGGLAATIYAAHRPTRGVVNVDQPIEVGDFARLLHDLAPLLHGPQFPQLWEQFSAEMHAELLPPAGEALVRSSSNPRQDVVLAYWAEVFDRSPEELADYLEMTLAPLADAMVPYTMVAGAEPSSEQRSRLLRMIPGATITVWPGSGHFPHIAHPDAFARVLASTATWPAMSTLVTSFTDTYR